MKTEQAPTEKTSKPEQKQPPMWNVVLHNDSVNDFEYVIQTLITVTRLDPMAAIDRTKEAHVKGMAVVVTCLKEHAEFKRDQLQSKRLTASIVEAPK
jgi:ATP-dependent Clp protease adaptor protein ClpS